MTEAISIASEPRIMVHVVAYNAVKTLARTLDRIPKDMRERLTEICVFDDASPDETYLMGEGYRRVRGDSKLHIFRNPANLGYGGNQKLGYRYAIEQGFDVVVLLHGDGQYAPEHMEDLIRPILNGEADAVFGSRMMTKGGALAGGMPLYKYVGNKILSRFENSMLGMDLSEFHSGYRAYSVKALAQIPFEENSNDFHFDTQIIIQMKGGGFRIREVPIPTYYGDEICHVNGVKYAKDVAKAVLDYRRHRAGLVHRPEYAHVHLPRYEEKESPFSTHQQILEAVKPGSKVLDVGCASGYMPRALRAKGCTVVGVDITHSAEAEEACDRFHVADLERPWEPGEGGFDYILFADVVEHLRDLSILERCKRWLAPGGRIIASTGNVALWYVRLSLLLGTFEYTPRGILDETHVHLYTRQSFRELFEKMGFEVDRENYTVIPLEALFSRLAKDSWARKMTNLFEMASFQLAQGRPELFAYQFILEAEPRRPVFTAEDARLAR